MMRLIETNLDLYRYEIHSLVREFYPATEIKVVVEGDERDEKLHREVPYVFLRVHFDRDCMGLILKDGEAAEPLTFERRRESGEPLPFNEKGKETKDILKTFLYETLSRVTGRQLPWGDLIGIRPTKIAMTRMENGETGEEAAAFLQREHHVSEEKANLAVDIAKREAKILSPIHYRDGFSLYIGIPFCPTTCLYCSFPSFNVALWKDRVDDYVDALIKEIAATADLMRGKILDTVYIGGGTPTTLKAEQLERLISAVEENFDTSHLCEFTVEAGRADSITKEKLEALRRHRVSRISVNPQTMKEETLRVIGRHHTVQQVRDSYRLARECGFDNINMDIILGLPGEDAKDARHTMEEIEKLSPDSLTVHSLAIKRASRLRRIIDEKGYPAFVNTEETMRIADEGARRMGMEPYYLYRQKQMSGNFENTGYAREDKYGIYNILIMEEKQSILALGAGSISKLVFYTENPDGTENIRIERADNPKDVATYIENIDEMIRRKEKLYRIQGR